MSSTIGSSLKRGRGQNESITARSTGENGNDAVIATHESIEGATEAVNDGLILRQTKRAKAESTAATAAAEATAAAADGSGSLVLMSSSTSSSSSTGWVVTEGIGLLSQLQSLLSPLVLQLQSMREQQMSHHQQLQSMNQLQIAQGQHLQRLESLSATVSSLSASMTGVKEDVAIIVKQVLPLTLVGGGLRSSNVLSVLYGAHGIGKGIFGFLDCKDGNNLRLVCHEMRTAVAAFPWNDKKTHIRGSLCSWRSCFPHARAASLWGRSGPLLDDDFRFFRGLHFLRVAFIESFSDASFSQLSGLKYLDISGCTQLTDAIFPHLVGLETLVMHRCPQSGISGTAFEPLRGSIQKIGTEGCRRVVKAAARSIAPRSMAKYLYDIARALPTGGSHVLEDGRGMNQRQLCLECLRLHPRFSVAYVPLACLLTSSERVSLPDGRSMNRRELYLEAIKHDPRCEYAYSNLANCMITDERIRLLDGRSMSKQELYLEALRLNHRCANAYGGLATTLTAEERVELPDGRHMSNRELYLECLRYMPDHYFTLRNLADTMTATEKVTLPDNRVMNARQLRALATTLK